MTQSHELSPLAAKNSSADANPRARYPSEKIDSTSAVRNGSSSSMTAIRGSPDTHHPRVCCNRLRGAVVASDGGARTLYTSVICYGSRCLGLDHFGHTHEVGQGPCAHFAHGRTPMKFYRDLAYSKIAGYLLVHFPGCHQHHHLLFPCGQCFEPLPHPRSIFIGSPPLSIAFDGHHHGIEHVLITERLRKKIHRASLHCADCHRNIAISGHHDYRQANTCLGQLGLELEPAHIGQADVDNDASRLIRKAGVEKVASRSVGSGVKSHRVEQALQRTAQRWVVVDHVHHRPIVRLERHWSGAIYGNARASIT